MTELPKQGLGIVLRREREMRGLSRRDLAERSLLSYPYMSELETGTKYPSQHALENIAASLDMYPSELERLAREAEIETMLPAEATTSNKLVNDKTDVISTEDQLVGEVLRQIEPMIRKAIRVALERSQ